MNPLKRVKAIAVNDLECLKVLVDAYNRIAKRPSSFNEQIVGDVTERVLHSDEFRNAMSYVNIEREELFKRSIAHTEEFLDLRNSPMTGLRVYQSNSSSSFTKNFALLGANIAATFEEIETSGELNAPLIKAILRLMIGIVSVYIAIDVSVGITQGASVVLFINLFLILTIILVVQLEVRSRNYKWAISEQDTDSMARTVIAPFIREQINGEMHKAQLEDSFNITIAPGLNDLSDRDQIIETATMRRVRTLLNTMTYGSIGISGARGTGKSVLLSAICDERLSRHDVPEFGILVAAPVDYDGRDFILHLFSTLCERIISSADTVGKRSAFGRFVSELCQLGMLIGGCLIAAEAGVRLSHSQIALAERLALATIVMFVILAVLTRFTGVSFATISRQASAEAPHLRKTTLGPLKTRSTAMLITGVAVLLTLVGAVIFANSKFYISPNSLITHILREKKFLPGVTVLACALAVSIVSTFIAYRRKGRHPSNITELAREHLRRIESIRTVSSGQSANVGFGGHLQLNHSRGSQLTERDLSLPAIVNLYREFTTDAVAWWRTGHGGLGRIVIGIDELDKITNTQSAERFLNEIKAVFGIPGCLYIVSTSQDALLQFERKSLGFRSAFDSAFDDVVRVDTLSLVDTQQLLLKRLAGISYPFIVLCHIFSGGLSRDVLRSARTVVEARCNGCISLTEICNFLISREITDLKKALLTAYAGHVTEHGRLVEDAFVGALLDDHWPGTNSRELLSVATPDLRDAFPEMHTALCFLATVYDLAISEHKNSWTDYFVPGVVQDGAEDLSGARRWLSSDPKTALELVRTARGKLGLRPLGYEGMGE
jgi:hypothetical protein